jgi:hypothetical protein
MHLPKKKESEQAIRLKGVKPLKIAELHRSKEKQREFLMNGERRIKLLLEACLRFLTSL